MKAIKSMGLKTAGASLYPAEITLRGAGYACNGTAYALRKMADGVDYVGNKSHGGANALQAKRQELFASAEALAEELEAEAPRKQRKSAVIA